MRYLKDKKITLGNMEKVIDKQGYQKDEFVPLENGENIWAYYRHLSGEELNINMVSPEVHKVECIFIINYRDDITTKTKLKYKGEIYNIEEIDDLEGYKTDLKIYAKRNTMK